MEAKEFGQYGGIWRAPKTYSFVARNNSQTNVELVKKFSDWEYSYLSIQKRMPWVCVEDYCQGIFLTASYDNGFWGSIVTGLSYGNDFGLPAPWMEEEQMSPGVIWYWIREGWLKLLSYEY